MIYLQATTDTVLTEESPFIGELTEEFCIESQTVIHDISAMNYLVECGALSVYPAIDLNDSSNELLDSLYLQS